MTTLNLLAYVPTLMLLCLGLMMFGLGLSLTLADFVRLKAHPKAVVIALSLQIDCAAARLLCADRLSLT
jgi:BASS family bile acid:Na+ symporter